MAAILNFKMAATRGREYVGGIFFPAPLGWVYPCAKFHACFTNWTILVLCRSTNRYTCISSASLLSRSRLRESDIRHLMRTDLRGHASTTTNTWPLHYWWSFDPSFYL